MASSKLKNPLMEEDLMKASKILLFALAALLISLNAFAAVEGSGVSGDNPPRHHPGMHDYNLLNLTPDHRGFLFLFRLKTGILR